MMHKDQIKCVFREDCEFSIIITNYYEWDLIFLNNLLMSSPLVESKSLKTVPLSRNLLIPIILSRSLLSPFPLLGISLVGPSRRPLFLFHDIFLPFLPSSSLSHDARRRFWQTKRVVFSTSSIAPSGARCMNSRRICNIQAAFGCIRRSRAWIPDVEGRVG